jgi:S1-C subfamily serine protease
LKALVALFAALLITLTVPACAAHAIPNIEWSTLKDPAERAVLSTVKVTTLEGDTFCSGTIVKGTGLILSAYHCFADNEPFLIKWNDFSFAAKLVVENEEQDVVVLRPLKGSIPLDAGVPLAARAPKLGETIFALGHALGDLLDFTLTVGIVSHELRVTEGQRWMQATTPLVGGMSGGGAYNERGELVGVNLFVVQQPTRCWQPPCPFQDMPVYGFAHFDVVTEALGEGASH